MHEAPRVDHVVALDGAGRPSARVGSKAASLDLLIGAGFPVPPALVVTTTAYRTFVAHADLDGLITDIAAGPVPASGAAEDRRRLVDEAFLSAPMPAAVLEGLHWAHRRLGHVPLAIRSSSIAEDLSQASFAGQYLSILGVEGFDELVEAVRLVWASLWHPWASAYRRRMGVPEDDLAMAAIVQRLLPADRSGVVFTRDPAEPELLRLEVVDGLGEGLVSGQVTPTVHQLRRPGLLPASGRAPGPLLRQAAHTALRIEQHFDRGPQDVEWSVVGDEVWILQARPITTVAGGAEAGDGFDSRTDPGVRYVAAGVTEMLPGVLPPLGWTIAGPMVEDAFRSLYAELGLLPTGLDRPFGFIARRRGRARLNLSLMEQVGQSVGGWSAEEVDQFYLGEGGGAAPPDGGSGFKLRSPLRAWRALRMRRAAPRAAESFRVAVEAALVVRPTVGELLDHELVAYRWRLRDLASSGMRAEVAVAAEAVTAYAALERLLERWVPEEAAEWAQRLTRAAGRGTRTPVDCARRRLAGVEPEHREALLAAVRDAPPGQAVQQLAAISRGGADLVRDVSADLAALGSAAVYAGRTWDERADSVWRAVARTSAAGDEDDGVDELARLEQHLTASRRWRVVRIVTGQVVDMRRRYLRRLVADATLLLARREEAKGALLMVGGEERRIIQEMARRLVRRGILARAVDVELLADWELDEALIRRTAPAAAELAHRRTVLARWRAEPAATLAPVAVSASGELRGWGASPGRHRGRAVVVLDPGDVDTLEPGAVLVTAATDPSWVPLLLQAGALVVERGGPLSHAAIVAREFDLPAVLNVSGATTLLSPGQEVDVDGVAGTVTILEPAAAAPAVAQ